MDVHKSGSHGMRGSGPRALVPAGPTSVRVARERATSLNIGIELLQATRFIEGGGTQQQQDRSESGSEDPHSASYIRRTSMKRMKDFANKVRGEHGITGLETAIVLIAFVVVAAVFAFVVLSTGLFSSERGKETVYAGLAKTRGSMELTGG